MAGGSDVIEDPFIELYQRVAGKLLVDWPVPPPIQKNSCFGGFYLSPVKTVVKTRLPLYPDYMAELTALWLISMSAPMVLGRIRSPSLKERGK